DARLAGPLVSAGGLPPRPRRLPRRPAAERV
ncbi:MAG: hypothetical protein AVDCRST_MAG65-2316, partial [uncultured Solirubrobacteraceae bacterium]